MTGQRNPDPPGGISGTIFTAGFSNLPLSTFLSNLRVHGIQVLVDVRSKPYASYTPHFNKDQIEVSATTAGLRYLYLGRELGGMPDNPGFYDDQGYVLYDRIAATEGFQVGINRLLDGLRKGYCLALTCGEDNPRHCHRRLLLGRMLREQGVAVAHILSSGTLISEAELLDEERRAPRQLSLFGGVEEEQQAWRSRHAVLPGRSN
ncbi:MAG: hypothetical protein CVU73_03640 [Deltaproteobacteria bacterium HGW-Deltaproteobacteria-8]|jgi:uncharacterized protein (DUF488 family)|nr:MAG: hypothetical protein CVU73_03640 [Deltaproteobacteria bacterium HGW-Deltaproteobacteria-8]